MIELVEELGPMYQTRHTTGATSFDCPVCKGRHIFFVIPPSKCEICNTKFPDLRMLKSSLDYRIVYSES